MFAYSELCTFVKRVCFLSSGCPWHTRKHITDPTRSEAAEFNREEAQTGTWGATPGLTNSLCRRAEPPETCPSSRLGASVRAGSSSADVRDSALRLTRRNFQNKPSGKENSKTICKLFPSSAVPPRCQSHREGFGRTERGTEGACQGRNVPSKPAAVGVQYDQATPQLSLAQLGSARPGSACVRAPAAARAPPGLSASNEVTSEVRGTTRTGGHEGTGACLCF